MTTRFVRLQQLDKRFGDLTVLHRVQLDVSEGEVLALLGPSGSGKTTCLRLLAGFETPDHGRIEVGGEDVTDLPPAKRAFGMVFQHYALFPHLSVGENVAFGLETRSWSRERIAARVEEMLQVVDLPGFQDRRLGQVSGGQQQRVALARALAPEPRLLLLDEPLSNLDPSLRERTRLQLRRTIDRVGITTVLVTHEQEEAFDLGDRVAVLHGGRLQQVATPEELYTQPATRFVATFIGRSNTLPAQLRRRPEGGAGGMVEVGLGEATWSWQVPADEQHDGQMDGPVDMPVDMPVDVVVRPEALSFAAVDAPNALPGEVVHRRYAGPISYFHVRLDPLSASPGAAPAREVLVPKDIEVLAPASAARPGDRVGLVLAAGIDDAIRPRLFAPEDTD